MDGNEKLLSYNIRYVCVPLYTLTYLSDKGREILMFEDYWKDLFGELGLVDDIKCSP